MEAPGEADQSHQGFLGPDHPIITPGLGQVFLARAVAPAAEGTSPADDENNQNRHFKNNSQFIHFSVQLRWELS